MHRRNLLNYGFGALVVWALACAVLAAGLAVAGQKGLARMPVLQTRELAEGVSYENLTVFPILARQWADSSGFATLDEALASGDALVTERGSEILRRSPTGRPIPIPEGGAQVNQLVLINRGAKPLVLLAGEVLTGGKQDRIIAKDRIVAPGGEPLPLDVFCVERGRWAGASSQFAASKLMAHPSVREKAAVDQKQHEVWAAVRSGSTHRSADAAGASAPAAAPVISERALGRVIADEAHSESYARVYQASRVGQSVEAFADELARRFARATSGLKPERVVGVVVAYGGEVAWADLFATPALFERYWPKLLRSYAVEALARPRSIERATLDDAREFLQPLAGRETLESEPGVYRWRQVTQGRYAEIELEALSPKALSLHWVKIQRTS